MYRHYGFHNDADFTASLAANNLHAIDKDCTEVRIAVVGDAGTGKTSLIYGLFNYHMLPYNDYIKGSTFVPRQWPLIRCTALFPDVVDVVVVDTSPEVEAGELEKADVIVLTFDCGRPWTLFYLEDWLSRYEMRCVPIIIAGCKSDRLTWWGSWFIENVIPHLKRAFPQIVDGIYCSARIGQNLSHVFHVAQTTVLFPPHRIFGGTGFLGMDITYSFGQLLYQICRYCDLNRDFLLDHEEFSRFQEIIFEAPLHQSEYLHVLNSVADHDGAVFNHALTYKGFAFLVIKFFKLDKIWTMIRRMHRLRN